jgi:membrane-associated phospholipid phosphatase
LGPARPSDNSPYSSHWEPFVSSHGVSGHAFVGAVPFLAAAEMTDDPLLKVGLIGLSTLPGWSRINDDAHYLSQVVLGWWLAFLSTAAVDHTEILHSRVCVVPLTDDNTVGIGLLARR